MRAATGTSVPDIRDPAKRHGTGAIWRARLRACVASALAALVVAAGALAGEPERPFRIVVLESLNVDPVVEHGRGFRDRMAALGYGPGVAEFEALNAEGDPARAEAMLRGALAAGRVDAVVAVATLAARAAHAVLRGGKVPLVFGIVLDPVAAGLVERTDAPSGTNVTGRVNTLSRGHKIAQILRVLETVRPGETIRFGVVHTDYPSAVDDLAELRSIAAGNPRIAFVAHGIPYRPLPANDGALLADLRAGVAALEDRVDFWWQVTGPLGMTAMATDQMLADSRHAIAYGANVESVRRGALLSMIPNFEAAGGESANLVDRILRGAEPGAIPVTMPGQFEIAVNLETAVALGVAVPLDLLELAGKNVFR